MSGAEPEGSWIRIHDPYRPMFKCRRCGEVTSDSIMGMPRYRYCPMCGKHMTAEPIRPIFCSDGFADGSPVYDYAECPGCGYSYEEGDKDWGEPYCPHCGMPLDWDEAETAGRKGTI